MSVNWDLYAQRVNINGENRREKLINNTKKILRKYSKKSYNCKSVIINNNPCDLLIDSTENPDVKKYSDIYDVIESAGTIIEWMNEHWIVDTIDSDSELYKKGKLLRCNYQLKFIDTNGRVTSRYCYIESIKRSIGVETAGRNVPMTMGNWVYSIKLPFDVDTALLDRTKSDGKNRRLLIDYGTNEPKAYEVTFADRITSPGIIIIYVNECQRSDKDNVELMVADYYTDIKPEASGNDCEISYIGSPTLVYGQGYKKFTAIFKDENGDIISNIAPVWAFHDVDESYLDVVTADNYIKIKVLSDKLIGKSFTLSLSNEEGTKNTSIVLEVENIG